MPKAPTIRDVAKAAGVSVSVVSRVLNSTGPVAPDTRTKVVQVIDELAYRPRAAARELSQGGQALAQSAGRGFRWRPRGHDALPSSSAYT